MEKIARRALVAGALASAVAGRAGAVPAKGPWIPESCAKEMDVIRKEIDSIVLPIAAYMYGLPVGSADRDTADTSLMAATHTSERLLHAATLIRTFNAGEAGSRRSAAAVIRPWMTDQLWRYSGIVSDADYTKSHSLVNLAPRNKEYFLRVDENVRAALGVLRTFSENLKKYE